jgi:SAM-dependent methyltransferase
MGQGRNAVYLAARGWRVTGFDYSEEGVQSARRAAREAGVDLTAVVASHEDFDFGLARWDLILMSYTWVPLRSPYVERVVAALAPGGILVFEHLMDESGSENAAPWLPQPNSLFRTFARLRVLRYEDVRAPADWSWRPERISRLVAQKAE